MKCACCEKEFDAAAARPVREHGCRGMCVFVCPSCFKSIERWTNLYGYFLSPFYTIKFVVYGMKLLEATMPLMFPTLDASEICKVQSMTERRGEIYYQEYKYDEIDPEDNVCTGYKIKEDKTLTKADCIEISERIKDGTI